MNLRYTLILVLLAAALGIFAYTQRDTEPVDIGTGTATPTPSPLFELKPEDVQEVAVVSATGSYTLTRVAGGWEVDGQPANDTVDGVVKSLAQPTIARELPADRDPDDYGFATPSLTVTLKTAGGESKVLQVGDDTPVDFNVYLREKDGTRIVIVGRSDITSLKDWVSTPPLAPTPTPTGSGTGTPGADGLTLPLEGTPGADDLMLPLEGTPGADIVLPADGTPAAGEGGAPADDSAAETTPEAGAVPGGSGAGTPAPVATATQSTS